MAQASGSQPGRLLRLTATLLLAAMALRLAYDIIRPILGWIIVTMVVIVVVKLFLHVQRHRW